ncbi:MAG: hypothetical protein ACE14T_07285 [Syntrophales bacterium]
MPFKDGTGPRRGGGRGGWGRRGEHRSGFGAGGYCVCPNCGLKMLHKTGVPCNQESCPECGSKMVREG